jgi:hypothetical protein
MKLHIAAGDTFSSWVVLAHGPQGTKKISRKWIVQCVCGKVTEKTSNELMSGKSRRCRQCDGRAHLVPMVIGQRFGHLVIESQARSRAAVDGKQHTYRQIRWNCRCDCGRLTEVAGYQLREPSRGTRQCFD